MIDGRLETQLYVFHLNAHIAADDVYASMTELSIRDIFQFLMEINANCHPYLIKTQCIYKCNRKDSMY